MYHLNEYSYNFQFFGTIIPMDNKIKICTNKISTKIFSLLGYFNIFYLTCAQKQINIFSSTMCGANDFPIYTPFINLIFNHNLFNTKQINSLHVQETISIFIIFVIELLIFYWLYQTEQIRNNTTEQNIIKKLFDFIILVGILLFLCSVLYSFATCITYQIIFMGH